MTVGELKTELAAFTDDTLVIIRTTDDDLYTLSWTEEANIYPYANVTADGEVINTVTGGGYSEHYELGDEETMTTYNIDPSAHELAVVCMVG